MLGETAASGYDFTVTEIFSVIERQPNPDWRWPIRHPGGSAFKMHRVVYAVSGKANYQIAGRTYRVTPEDIVLIPKGTHRVASSDRQDPWHFISVGFDVTGSTDVTAYLDTLPHVTCSNSAETSSAFRDIAAAWRGMEPGYLLQIRAALLNVLHRLVKIHTLPTLRQPHTQRIMTIAKILRDGYGMSYRVDELAHMAGLSPSHFRLTFKNVTGMSPSTYQQQVKIAKATELLSDGECNVSEAARTVGFTDVHYFSRLYKKVTGNTPSSLIRQ